MDRYITTAQDITNSFNRADVNTFLANRKAAQDKDHRAMYRAKLLARKAARTKP